MKNLMFASAFFFLAFNNASANSLPQNTLTPHYETLSDMMKPRVKIIITIGDNTITITISFRTTNGGGDNTTGTLTAVGKQSQGVDFGQRTSNIDVQSFSWGASNPAILNGATDIVVTEVQSSNGKNPTGIKVGDKLQVNTQGFKVASTASYDLKAAKK